MIDRRECECGWLHGLCVGPGINLPMSLQCNRHQHPQEPLVPSWKNDGWVDGLRQIRIEDDLPNYPERQKRKDGR